MSNVVNNAHRRFEKELQNAEKTKKRKVLMIDAMDLDETPNPTINDFRSLRKLFISSNAFFHLDRINRELGMVGRDDSDDPFSMTNTASSYEFHKIFKKEIRKCNKLYTNQKYSECMDNLIGIIMGLKDYPNGFFDTDDQQTAQRILNNFTKIWKNIIYLNYKTIGIENDAAKQILFQILEEIKEQFDDIGYTFKIGQYAPSTDNNYEEDDDDDDDDDNNNNNNNNNRRRVRPRNELATNPESRRNKRRRLNNNNDADDEQDEKDDVLFDYIVDSKEIFGPLTDSDKLIYRDYQLKLKKFINGDNHAFEPRIQSGIDWDSMTVDELRKYLKKYRFKSSGRKSELVYRLKHSKEYIVSLKKEYHKAKLVKKTKKGENIEVEDIVFDASNYVFDPFGGGRIIPQKWWKTNAKRYFLTMSTPFGQNENAVLMNILSGNI